MIGDFIEAVDWLRAGVSGWRFMFSASFRNEALAKWKNESRYYVLWDVVCGFAGVVFSLLLVGGLFYALFSLR
jgi:hypothetical protein